MLQAVEIRLVTTVKLNVEVHSAAVNPAKFNNITVTQNLIQETVNLGLFHLLLEVLKVEIWLKYINYYQYRPINTPAYL